MAGWTVAPIAGDDELDRVAALEAASFSSPWTRETLARELERPEVTRVYVIKEPLHGIIGFCSCWLIADEVHINSLAIEQPARRRGAATALLDHVLDDLAAQGARQATLEVRRSNTAALALYRRAGFVIVSARPAYYSQPEEDALILWCHDLRRRAAAP